MSAPPAHMAAAVVGVGDIGQAHMGAIQTSATGMLCAVVDPAPAAAAVVRGEASARGRQYRVPDINP